MDEEQEENNGGQGENVKLTATDMEDNVAVIRVDKDDGHGYEV